MVVQKLETPAEVSYTLDIPMPDTRDHRQDIALHRRCDHMKAISRGGCTTYSLGSAQYVEKPH